MSCIGLAQVGKNFRYKVVFSMLGPREETMSRSCMFSRLGQNWRCLRVGLGMEDGQQSIAEEHHLRRGSCTRYENSGMLYIKCIQCIKCVTTCKFQWARIQIDPG